MKKHENNLLQAIHRFRETGELIVVDEEERETLAHILLSSSWVRGNRTCDDPKWIVESCTSINNLFASTLSVPEWIEKVSKPRALPFHVFPKAYSKAWNELLDAYFAFRTEAGMQYSPVSVEPRVGYDPLSDTNFFIFPLQNDDSSYVVSRLGIVCRIGNEVPDDR